MSTMSAESFRGLEEIVKQDLKPYVKRIDVDAYYPADYLKALGREGYLSSAGKEQADVRVNSVKLLEETSVTCMTTGFNLWCHQALLTYVRLSENKKLKGQLLPRLENGDLLGGTGLSNPMKFYAGIDQLYLKARRVENGYLLSGNLPMVSNLGENHWFAVIAAADNNKRIMTVVPCHSAGLRMIEQTGFLGINGSATYACQFRDVVVPDDWVLSDQADDYVQIVRSTFVLYQIPLGLGVVAASLHAIRQAKEKQCGCNSYLPVQAEQLERELERLRSETLHLAAASDIQALWPELLKVRLATVYLTLNAVQACMLHQGSAGYTFSSHPSRRLREAYFFANLTPTVRHLEKLTSNILLNE